MKSLKYLISLNLGDHVGVIHAVDSFPGKVGESGQSMAAWLAGDTVARKPI